MVATLDRLSLNRGDHISTFDCAMKLKKEDNLKTKQGIFFILTLP